MIPTNTEIPEFSDKELELFNMLAGVEFPRKVQVLEYNRKPLIGDARLNFTVLDGVVIETPDNYFTFNPDGTRPDDILFTYTPGEHTPDWDYSREALLDACRNNRGLSVVDAGCGTGIKNCLLNSYILQEELTNQILTVDPNPRAIQTTFQNNMRNGSGLRNFFQKGTLRSALQTYQDQEIAGAFINPPYQARPEHVDIALHCDGGSDGLKICRELLEDLIPYLADGGVCAVHTKSPAYADRNGFEVWPLIIDEIVRGEFANPDELDVRFSRTCAPMDLFDFYRLVYREQENDFAGVLADQYPLIDMTLALITKRKSQKEVNVIEDSMPQNPEGIEWGVKDREVVEPGHVVWHMLFVPKTSQQLY